MLFYRVLRAVNEAFALTVLFIYIGMFFIALTLMFAFPPAPIILVFAGLFGLPVAIGIGMLLKFTLHSLSKGYLRMGCCPACGHRAEGEQPLMQDEWTCPECDMTFTKRGELRPTATIVDVAEQNRGQGQPTS